MQDFETPGDSAFLSRSDLELQLARLALVVMRAAPDAFADFGGVAPKADPLDESPADIAAHLLRSARPEHRPFLESRLVELSRCMSGMRGASSAHDWFNVTLPVPAAQPGDAGTAPGLRAG